MTKTDVRIKQRPNGSCGERTKAMTRDEKFAEARRLRAEGKLLREISVELDVPRSTISQWLNDPDGVKLKERKRRYHGECEVCGAETIGTSSGYDKTPRFCREHGLEHSINVISERSQEHRAKVEELWKQGLTLRQMAAEMGWAQSTARVRVSQLRAQGFDLPYRRTPEQVARIKTAAGFQKRNSL